MAAAAPAAYARFVSTFRRQLTNATRWLCDEFLAMVGARAALRMANEIPHFGMLALLASRDDSAGDPTIVHGGDLRLALAALTRGGPHGRLAASGAGRLTSA